MVRGAFWDLAVNVRHGHTTVGDVRALITAAKESGYRGIALNTTVSGRLEPGHACSTRALVVVDPELAGTQAPLDATSPVNTVLTPSFRPAFRVLHRLTVRVQEAADLYVFNAANESLLSYDILAVEVSEEKLLQQAMLLDCIDLISFPSATRASFQLKRTQVHACAKRGILFELSLASLLTRDQVARRYALQNSRTVCQRTNRGSRCVLVSGAESPMQMRGPLDMANLACVLFGMSEANSIASVSSFAEFVIRHAEYRRVTGGKGACWIGKIASPEAVPRMDDTETVQNSKSEDHGSA
ncbi:ribonuclease P protein subunit p30 [Cyanidioschyzon merolae strain 10D]|uniref:Ribonuclease P protein subunit p30 n=1 Tax=Cyanidioschyzon merolae (strain NIES-3377 / 10D) TaxID=280699 RepID=M1V8W2_CYAM1|nr:ribonuclease P protein subunit p30 [Cyanidioschyzon merolae strain 10D]BAM81009.1 ribonuclease P protein subunit p30 [Cyanidioschyzon merolae strain 10D]|eukprot:XP_005537045.1 ribonuclease P protein subunit p30 [Cyanidioschyzon merolae strain 10D]